MFTLPNALTILRILLVPVFVVALVIPGDTARIVAFAVFCLAGISDGLDGFAARKLKAGSDFGRMLDPIADKVLVGVALMMLVAEGTSPVRPAQAASLLAGAGADHPGARDSGVGLARISGGRGSACRCRASPRSRPRCR